MDGMSVMSGNGTGGVNFGNYLNNAMAQELVVNTDSISAEFELSGVTSNFITRSGSNAVHGAFSGRYANTALQSRNLSADLIARGLTSGNRIKRIWDANPSAGGPLLRDRVWLFSSARHWGTYNYVAGLYDDLDPTALFYTPDLSSPAIQPVWHFNADARLTFQATTKNTISAYYHHQYTDFGTCFEPTRLTAPSGCASQHERSPVVCPGELELAADQSGVNRGGRDDHEPRTRPAAGIGTCRPISRPSRSCPQTSPGGRRPKDSAARRNNQSNYRASVSYVTGTHAAKVGLTLMQQWRCVGNERNNGVNYTFLNGAPNRLTQFAEPDHVSRARELQPRVFMHRTSGRSVG